MGKALTEAKKQIATQLYASGGVTVSEISRQIGVSQATLSHWINKQPWYVVKYTTPNSSKLKQKTSKTHTFDGDPVKANENVRENTFVIPGVLPGLNEYIKAIDNSRYEGNKLKRDTEDFIIRCIHAGLGKYKTAECVVQVHIKFIERDRRRDYDNITSATKFILDAMRTSGVIYNDGQSFLLPSTFEYGTDKDDPRVVVTITYHPEMKISGTLIKKSKARKAKSLRYMSDGEIRQAYRLAANKEEQIKILAELNAMSVSEVVGIVEEIKATQTVFFDGYHPTTTDLPF